MHFKMFFLNVFVVSLATDSIQLAQSSIHKQGIWKRQKRIKMYLKSSSIGCGPSSFAQCIYNHGEQDLKIARGTEVHF